MTQLAVLLFAVVLLAALVAFVDALRSRQFLTRERRRSELLKVELRKAIEGLAKLQDALEVKGRTLAENADELRRSGLFGDDSKG